MAKKVKKWNFLPFYFSAYPLGKGKVLESDQKSSSLKTQFLDVLGRDIHESGQKTAC